MAARSPPFPATSELRDAEVALTQRREGALARLSGFVARQEAASRAATVEILELQAQAKSAIAASALAVLALIAATALFVTRRSGGRRSSSSRRRAASRPAITARRRRSPAPRPA